MNRPKFGLRVVVAVAVAVGLGGFLGGGSVVHARFLDEENTLYVGGVFYNQIRIRTTEPRGANTPVGDWTMMQHRYFLDPVARLDLLPWIGKIPGGATGLEFIGADSARFYVNYRFEYDGVYDYGPKAFRDLPDALQNPTRSELYEAYGDISFLGGAVSLRGGRQNLSWGETDSFRLLDRINPLDNGFGGFLLPLDERRRPLTMVRLAVGLPDFGEIQGVTVEGFVAPDKRLPASAPGPTPWGVLGASAPPPPPLPPGAPPPPPPPQMQLERPDRSMADNRQGVRLSWTVRDVSFSLAHLSTYPDSPTPLLRLAGGAPVIKLKFPNMQVTGMTASAPIPGTYAVFRSEVAGFFGEPFFIPAENFSPPPNLKRLPKRDVIRGVVGLDHNQWIRALNPFSTFFFTGQFFYTNIRGSVEGLSVPLRATPTRFIKVDRETFLNTLTTNTTYAANNFFGLFQLQPQITFFYNWEGAFLVQPLLTFIRDPFRFRVEYNWLDGRFVDIGTLQDKDNLAFRVDYLF